MANYDRYGREDRYGRGQDPRDYRARDDDRGFFDRAGDEVRSWFGDNDAERRRARDGDGYHFDGRDDRYENRSDAGFRGTYPRGSTSGSDDYGRRNYANSSYGASVYGSDFGRFADRSAYGERYSTEPSYSRFDRGFGAYNPSGDFVDRQDHGAAYDRSDYGRSNTGYPTGQGRNDEDRTGYSARGAGHDDDYRSWRDRQLKSFDRDYADYRRERQQRFHNEFDQWRQTRTGGQTQYEAEHNGTHWRTKIREHQEVLGSDGGHVGVVDHVEGDRIKLTKRDGDGQHHFIPLTSIASVDSAVRLSTSADDAKRQWRTETSATGTTTTTSATRK